VFTSSIFTSSGRLNSWLKASGFVLCAGLLHAAPAQPPGWISAPMVGLFASQDGTAITAIVGVPGASILVDPLVLPQGVTRVHLGPTQQWALVEQVSGTPFSYKALGLMGFTGAQPGTVELIKGALPAPDLVSFSPTGASAILLDRASGQLQVIGGLNKTPGVVMETSVSDMNPSSIAAIAINDAGTLPVVEDGNGRMLLASGGSSRPMIFAGYPSAGMAFLPNQSLIAVADVNSGKVWMVGVLPTAPPARVVASIAAVSGAQGLVRTSSDARFLFVAAAGGKSAVRVDLSDGGMTELDLPTTSSALEQLGDGQVFLISAPPGESAWMLVSDGSGLKAVFAAPSGQPGQ